MRLYELTTLALRIGDKDIPVTLHGNWEWAWTWTWCIIEGYRDIQAPKTCNGLKVLTAELRIGSRDTNELTSFPDHMPFYGELECIELTLEFNHLIITILKGWLLFLSSFPLLVQGRAEVLFVIGTEQQ